MFIIDNLHAAYNVIRALTSLYTSTKVFLAAQVMMRRGCTTMLLTANICYFRKPNLPTNVKEKAI